ncbi:hypothetical protein CIB84_006453, partial [Bambusicola thoracicus]
IELLEQPLFHLLSCPIDSDLKSVKARKPCSDAVMVPTASVTIEGASALNRVRWAQAGKEVAVGDSEGRIWIYDVGEDLKMSVVAAIGNILRRSIGGDHHKMPGKGAEVLHGNSYSLRIVYKLIA